MRKTKARLGRINVNGHKHPFIVTYSEPNVCFRRLYSKNVMTVPLYEVMKLIQGYQFTVEGVNIQAKTSDQGLVLSSGTATRTISWKDVVEMVEGQTVMV